MKRQLLTLLATGTVCSMFAQLPVSTTAQNKKIVLEEFTGIHCGYCPDGHTIANNIYNNNPGKVILINIHSGSFANSVAGEQDLKTAMGNAIDAMPGMGITGYPSGTVNRTVLSGSAMAGGRGSWTGWSNTIKNQAAYCNVAVEGSVDATTRVLTYTAQVYYTANSPVATNSLTIMLLEDKVLGIQSNYGNPAYNASNYNADGTYNHNHVLRRGLTSGNFGITIPVTTTGTTFTTSGTYTIPATYGATNKTTPCLLGNIELAAFVTETNVKTINGAYGPITITNIANANDGGVNNIITDVETCAGNLMPTKFNLVNTGSSNLTSATITYSATGGSQLTYNFTGNLAPFTQTIITLPAYSFVANPTNTLSINITNVNGGTDQNAANDIVMKSIPLTTRVANAANLTMEFTQDAYGTESTWEIREEVSNALIASGGPYSDIGTPDPNTGNLPPATQLHTQAFTVSSNLCYKVVVNDEYGDGFNAGFGVGNYKIKAGTTTIYTMNGTMGLVDTKLFRTSVFTGINEGNTTVTNVSVYPSPAKNSASISLDLIQNETISINVVNTVGQIVYSESLNDLSAGNHIVNFNTEAWANGIYNIHISTPNGTTNRKLVITK